MPQGLAPVSNNSAASRRVLRRHAKWLLGAVLVLAPILTPIESSVIPDAVEDLITTSTAAAQLGSVISGTPDPCPTLPEPWNLGGPLDPPGTCVLERPACPVSPLSSTIPGVDVEYALSASYTNPGGLSTFQDFCEARILQVDDPVAYADCLAARGAVVLIYVDGGNPGCRLVAPASCTALLHRINAGTCRGVQRRSWDCPTGSIPRNEFNTCFVLPAISLTAHPACGAGAPSFPILSCAEYVDTDFIDPADPGAPTCASYGHMDNALAGVSSDYWCEYDSSLLDVSCHAAGASLPDANGALHQACQPDRRL